MQNSLNFKTVFARVLHLFRKAKIAHKNAVISTFSTTCFHQVSQKACKMHLFQNVFVRIQHAFTKVEIPHEKRRFLLVFFQTCLQKVSQNACKLHSITHKKTVFSKVSLKLSPQTV